MNARQLSLLEPSTDNGTSAAFRKRSPTSRAAAEHVNQTLSTRQARVLKLIRVGGKAGATCAEIAGTLNTEMHNVSGRIRELAIRGAIYDSGQRRVNPASGVSQTAWRIV